MVIDTSAVIAIILGEPDHGTYSNAILNDGVRFMSSASVLEASVVVDRRFPEEGASELDLLILSANIETVPFDAEQLQIARRAFRAYGRGRHPAGLNFGDCFSYALSKATGEPLLFKGGDFALTDVDAVL